MTTLSGSSGSLIPEAAAREGNDPIFALHGEAVRRAAAGESILNSTLGALMYDDGSLAVMPAAAEALGRVPHARAAGYAPISGDPPYLAAVIADLLGEGGLAEQAVAVATPGSTGAIHHAILNFLEPGQAALTPSYYWGPYHTISTHSGRAVETFNMFDAQAWYVRDVIMGRIQAPDREARAADVVDREAREDALEDDYAAIRYQGDYVRELIADTDYPSFDVDGANDAFFQWKKHKKQNIMAFRDNGYKSVMTGTMAPNHHTPWVDAMDDSMESYLRSG